jgi:pimeloyl-ACP methyl ester carboxylesterase
MKKILFILILVSLFSCSSTKKIKTENSIAKMQTLSLGGVDQWTLIRGENKANPVVLFLHGGPGASETALFRKYNNVLEKDFTLVFWDQRGTTKSYSKHIPKESMNLKQLISDAGELIEYVKKEFNKDKIILVGHSWGTVLGMELIKQNPENFICYVGVGQVIHSERGEIISYNYTLEKAKEANNKKAISQLEKMGEPVKAHVSPWDMGTQRKWLLKFGGERHQKNHYRDYAFTFLNSREYTFFDVFKFAKGSAFSWPLRDDEEKIDFFAQAPNLDVPVFYCGGKYDFNTPTELVMEYVSNVNAPFKKFVEFENSGHMLIFEEADKFNQFMVSDVLPLANQ